MPVRVRPPMRYGGHRGTHEYFTDSYKFYGVNLWLILLICWAFKREIIVYLKKQTIVVVTDNKLFLIYCTVQYSNVVQ